MKKYRQSISKLMLGSITAGLIGLSSLAYAGSASSVFNFTATFVGGTCEISAPSDIQFNDGNTFSSAEIEQQTTATQKEFEITLSNCNGWGLTPSIKVSGTTISDFGVSLFRDQMGQKASNGYGILLATSGNNTFEPNPNLAAEGTIGAKNWSTNSQLNTIDTTLRMAASLRCGECNYPGRRGGEFKATVTFDFIYE